MKKYIYNMLVIAFIVSISSGIYCSKIVKSHNFINDLPEDINKKKQALKLIWSKNYSEKDAIKFFTSQGITYLEKVRGYNDVFIPFRNDSNLFKVDGSDNIYKIKFNFDNSNKVDKIFIIEDKKISNKNKDKNIYIKINKKGNEQYINDIERQLIEQYVVTHYKFHRSVEPILDSSKITIDYIMEIEVTLHGINRNKSPNKTPVYMNMDFYSNAPKKIIKSEKSAKRMGKYFPLLLNNTLAVADSIIETFSDEGKFIKIIRFLKNNGTVIGISGAILASTVNILIIILDKSEKGKLPEAPSTP
ncbi:MAG: hypothetical protein GF329_10455 [Candidatus Lokiarchaeota archaeon]|nr:hypothetical protein [Candidatus Lokiarchaeota archaeon]